MNGPPSILQIVLLTTVVIITGVITCYYLYSINHTLMMMCVHSGIHGC